MIIALNKLNLVRRKSLLSHSLLNLLEVQRLLLKNILQLIFRQSCQSVLRLLCLQTSRIILRKIWRSRVVLAMQRSSRFLMLLNCWLSRLVGLLDLLSLLLLLELLLLLLLLLLLNGFICTLRSQRTWPVQISCWFHLLSLHQGMSYWLSLDRLNRLWRGIDLSRLWYSLGILSLCPTFHISNLNWLN